MEFKDISPENTLFIEGEEEKVWNLPSNNSVKEIGKEKIDSLKRTIKEIKELIDGREELSREIFNEGEKIKTEITNFLLENDAPHLQDSPEAREAIREKNALRQKKIEISELQLNEKVSCWKDVALLKRELRERQRELDERESRMNMLGDILKEN